MNEEYVRQTLGVSPQLGGEHPRMGTYNCLLKLGEKLYLEIICINPNAPQPNRPRWYQLDTPDPSQPIRLATWIARTDDIYAAVNASPLPLGEVESMSRGQLHWQITIPADGSLPLQGIAPILIQWPDGVHPATMLKESRCTLEYLEGNPTLCTDEGKTQLSPGMCSDFKAGTGNAHHLINETVHNVVYLKVGDRTPGDEATYPDDDLQAVLSDGK